jgi:hypothetical protein
MSKRSAQLALALLSAATLLTESPAAHANPQWPGLFYPGNQAPPKNGVNYGFGGIMNGTTDAYLIFYGDWGSLYQDPEDSHHTWWSSANDENIIITYFNALGSSSLFKILTTYFDEHNRHPTGLNVAGVWSVPAAPQYTLQGTFTVTQTNSVLPPGTYPWMPPGFNANLYFGPAPIYSTLQNLIHDQIKQHSSQIAHPDHSIFIVFSSPHTFLWDVDGNQNPSWGDCGFHFNIASIPWSDLPGFTRAPIFAAVDPPRSGCGAGSYPNSALADLEINAATHELFEAVANPNPGSGWTPDIGDNCVNFSPSYSVTGLLSGQPAQATVHVGAGDYLVQRMWVNSGGGYCGFNVRTPGDFNGDGRSDIVTLDGALSTANDSDQIFATPNPTVPGGPVGDGTFANAWMGVNFNVFSNNKSAQVVTGDFNGNGRTGLAAAGGFWSGGLWNTVPVAYANGSGGWTINNAGTNFNYYVNKGAGRVIAGDFNGDGKTDLAALNSNTTFSFIPLIFNQGNGTWSNTYGYVSDMANLGYAPYVFTGDFNGDGYTDIAATGVNWWNTIPVAFSNGDGSFVFKNYPSSFAATTGQLFPPHVVAGDFNGDGLTDIAAVAGWNSTQIDVALSNGDGTFTVKSYANDFYQYSSQGGVLVLAGDYNGDGRDDLAAVGGYQWNTIPVAFTTPYFSFANTDNATDWLFTLYAGRSSNVSASSWLNPVSFD